MNIHLLSVGLGLVLGTSVVVFLIIILLFVALLLGVRAKLMPKGDVVININGEKDVTVQPGGSLLSTLAAQKYFCLRLVEVKVLVDNAVAVYRKVVAKYCQQKKVSLLVSKYKIIGDLVAK